MSIKQHTRFSTENLGTNLVNNGGFTQYLGSRQVLRNTASDRSSIAKDIVNVDLYGGANYGFRSTDNELGFWEFDGVPINCTISPERLDGTILTSWDGGNVCQFTLVDDGTATIAQTLYDPRRLEGQICSFAFSGVTLQGAVSLTLFVELDGETQDLLTLSSSAFGRYRRFGATVQMPEEVDTARVGFRILGCSGDTFGLAGVCGLAGTSQKVFNFTPSLVDLAVPSGTVFMFEGDTCPPGYYQYDSGYMALVSGTKAFQEVMGEDVFELGADTHDHTGSSNLTPGVDDFVSTAPGLPFDSVSLVRAAPFGQYPLSLAYQPYSGETPQVVLGTNHTHRYRSDMTSVPPTFPITYCRKL